MNKNIERLLQVTQDQLTACLKRKDEAEAKIKSYNELVEKLSTLPDKLSYEKLIPVSPLALMPGFLKSTNKIHVYLADGYIIETSAKNAVQIANRQIKRYETLITQLNSEKQRHENWISYIKETSNPDLIDITEHITEEEYQQMKEKHIENVKKYRQHLKESPVNFEGLDEKLDDKELADEDISPSRQTQEDITIEKINSYIEKLKLSEQSYLRGRIKPLDSERGDNKNEEIEEEKESLPEKKEPLSENNLHLQKLLPRPKREDKKRVRWREEAEEEIPKIHFNHTKTLPKNSKLLDENRLPFLSRIIIDPGDIYTSFLANRPKPILKVPPDFTPNVQPFTCTKKTTQKNKVITKEPISLNPFSGEVKESLSPRKLQVIPTRLKQSLFKERNKK